MSDSLWPHGLQYARLPCPSPTPGVYSNSCPLSRWCHQPSHPLLSPFPPAFKHSQHQGLFSNESVLPIRWPKYWSFSFSISPSIEYSGLISFRMNWLDLLAVPGTLKSLLQQHSSETLVLCRSWSVLCSLFLKESVTAGIKVAAIWFYIKTHVWRENRRSERLDKDFREKVARRATLSPLNPSYTHTLTHMRSPGAWRMMKC